MWGGSAAPVRENIFNYFTNNDDGGGVYNYIRRINLPVNLYLNAPMKAGQLPQIEGDVSHRASLGE